MLLAVEATLAEIERSPELFQVIHQDARRALLKRFPYGVIYLLDRSSISVIAIFHAKRDPREWQRRANG